MGIMKLSNILWNMEQVGFWIKRPKDKPFQAGDQGAYNFFFIVSSLLGSFSALKANSSPVAYES